MYMYILTIIYYILSIIIYIYGGCSKLFFLQTAILRESKKHFRESFPNPTFIFRGGLMFKSFPKSFAQTKLLSLTQKKTFAGSHVVTLALAI